jgi:uncharacterized surface anchored protein
MHFRTDSQGQFSVAKIAPGHHYLVRVIQVSQDPQGFATMLHGNKIPFDIQAGQTTTLDLAATSHTVTTQLQWPAGMQQQPQWYIYGFLGTPQPDMPKNIATNETLRNAFMQSDEYRTDRFNTRLYPANINADNTISFDEVSPGDYELKVFVNTDAGTNSQLTAEAHIAVPTDPPAGMFDVGTIPLESVPTTP